MASNVSRSVYVGQVRRAFLLRAHPDRFRKHTPSIRQRQSTLLQKLNQRMNDKDFQAYISYSSNSLSATTHFYGPKNQNPIPFVLEKRDGSLLQHSLKLNDSVENVLRSLVQALKMSGATTLPPPPVAPSSNVNFGGEDDNILWAPNNGNNKGNSTSTIDHRFDVNSKKGRDLSSFLTSITPDLIEERRMARMDASAAALVARRLYRFSAIDPPTMGWSSDSFAVLLKSLIRLHDEHTSRFHVDSFYPLRLQFFSDSGLDVYGGSIHLRPAATQLEWLESFQEVTPERLNEYKELKQQREEYLTVIQNSFGIKLSKGHSCDSNNYHYFAERIAEDLLHQQDNAARVGDSATTRALEVERLRLVIESPEALRRPRATKEGTILVNSNMTQQEIVSAISTLSGTATTNLVEEKENRLKCKEAITQSQWALGLQRVSRIGLVKHSEFLSALGRLIDRSKTLRGSLAGFSVGICGSGRYCHVGDDGSLILPHDWT